jgi:SAM-dependent MidA family methyltransferase
MNVEASRDLAESIRAEIETSGPITFARFMERALTDPAFGYYATAADRPTRSGDFLTAPELHPIFGHVLAHQLDEMWQLLGRPDPFVLREFGAGTGSLFLAIADGLARMDSALASRIRYEPVDFARQRALIFERLAAAGRANQVMPINERGALCDGAVVANEYIDALPVHRVIKIGGELREIYVAYRDDLFTEVAGPLSDDRLAAWFADAAIELGEGQRAEVNLAMLDWLDDLATTVERGYVIVIDYGASARDLYDARRRPNGTVRAFSGNQVSSDVLTDPGSRDITSHVDFDTLDRHARACGFEVLGRRRSNEFLMSAGLDDVYQHARAEAESDWESATTVRSAIQRLLDPNSLGGYLVDVLSRNAPAGPLMGFAPLPSKR